MLIHPIIVDPHLKVYVAVALHPEGQHLRICRSSVIDWIAASLYLKYHERLVVDRRPVPSVEEEIRLTNSSLSGISVGGELPRILHAEFGINVGRERVCSLVVNAVNCIEMGDRVRYYKS